MLAKLTVVSDVVLQLPESGVVLLNGTLVVAAHPASQVNGWFEALSLAGTDVVAKLGMPYEVLYRCHLKEDVSGQLLAVKQDVVQHCQCHRVGACVSLSHC